MSETPPHDSIWKGPLTVGEFLDLLSRFPRDWRVKVSTMSEIEAKALDILREIVDCHTSLWAVDGRLIKALDDARTLINSGARASSESEENGA